MQPDQLSSAPCTLPRLVTTLLLTLLLIEPAAAQRQSSDDERMIDDSRVQHRSYEFPGTGEQIPFALFVPESYDAEVGAPLIISLHGLGRSYDWLMGYHGFLDYAEAGGFIVATPLGYIRRGWYGTEDVAQGAEIRARSEEDVMQVLDRVLEEFNVDERRIYLWGHSMGGAGTFYLAKRNPDLFAGLAVVAPAPRSSQSPADLEAYSHVPILVMHGDADDVVPVDVSREWVAKMEELGMQHLYVEVADGDHSLLISQNPENMKKIVDFFNIVRKDY